MIISDDRWNDLVDEIKAARIHQLDQALEAAVESSAPLVGYIMHRHALEQHRGLVAHLISENGTGGSDLNRADEILDALAKAVHPLDSDECPMPTCTKCGAYHEIVRPGKTQPTCLCEAFERECERHKDTVQSMDRISARLAETEAELRQMCADYDATSKRESKAWGQYHAMVQERDSLKVQLAQVVTSNELWLKFVREIKGLLGMPGLSQEREVLATIEFLIEDRLKEHDRADQWAMDVTALAREILGWAMPQEDAAGYYADKDGLRAWRDIRGWTHKQHVLIGNQDHAFEELSAANKANIERWKKAEAHLKALVDKLRAIQADPSYQGIWTFLSVHGYVYTGPDWSAEVLAATTALP